MCRDFTLHLQPYLAPSSAPASTPHSTSHGDVDGGGEVCTGNGRRHDDTTLDFNLSSSFDSCVTPDSDAHTTVSHPNESIVSVCSPPDDEINAPLRPTPENDVDAAAPLRELQSGYGDSLGELSSASSLGFSLMVEGAESSTDAPPQEQADNNTFGSEGSDTDSNMSERDSGVGNSIFDDDERDSYYDLSQTSSYTTATTVASRRHLSGDEEEASDGSVYIASPSSSRSSDIDHLSPPLSPSYHFDHGVYGAEEGGGSYLSYEDSLMEMDGGDYDGVAEVDTEPHVGLSIDPDRVSEPEKHPRADDILQPSHPKRTSALRHRHKQTYLEERTHGTSSGASGESPTESGVSVHHSPVEREWRTHRRREDGSEPDDSSERDTSTYKNRDRHRDVDRHGAASPPRQRAAELAAELDPLQAAVDVFDRYVS